MKIFRIIVISALLFTTGIFIGTTHAGQTEQLAKVEKKEVVSASIVEPATQPTVATDTRDTLVYSFYDTQLQVVCFVASSGIWCTSLLRLSDVGQDFVMDRTKKAMLDLKEKIGKVGGATIIPRVVSLDK